MDVLTTGDTHRGADYLNSTLRGIEESRAAAGSDPHVTTVAHSYGSLTAGIAAQEGAQMDDLVLIGSPGVDSASVAGLGMTSEHVYVGEAEGKTDYVAASGSFNRPPQSDYFEATVFQTDRGPVPGGGASTLESNGHSQYCWDNNTESLRNITAVTAGHPELLTVRPNALAAVGGP